MKEAFYKILVFWYFILVSMIPAKIMDWINAQNYEWNVGNFTDIIGGAAIVSFWILGVYYIIEKDNKNGK